MQLHAQQHHHPFVRKFSHAILLTAQPPLPFGLLAYGHRFCHRYDIRCPPLYLLGPTVVEQPHSVILANSQWLHTTMEHKSIYLRHLPDHLFHLVTKRSKNTSAHFLRAKATDILSALLFLRRSFRASRHREHHRRRMFLLYVLELVPLPTSTDDVAGSAFKENSLTIIKQ